MHGMYSLTSMISPTYSDRPPGTNAAHTAKNAYFPQLLLHCTPRTDSALHWNDTQERFLTVTNTYVMQE